MQRLEFKIEEWLLLERKKQHLRNKKKEGDGAKVRINPHTAHSHHSKQGKAVSHNALEDFCDANNPLRTI